MGKRGRVVFELRMANERADVDGVCCDLNRVEAGDPVDVDQMAG